MYLELLFFCAFVPSPLCQTIVIVHSTSIYALVEPHKLDFNFAVLNLI